MAVQAQYVSNGFGRSRGDVIEEQQLWSTFLGNAGGGLQVVNGTTVFSDHGSELTCNGSGTRKRSREESEYLQEQLPGFQTTVSQKRFSKGVQPISTGLQLFSEDTNRLVQSAMTSTTGRPPASSTPVAAIPALRQDLLSNLHQQNLEINALIRLQNEKLRERVKETMARNQQAVLAMLGQQFQKRLKEKDAQIELATRRNAELEEKLKQIAAENQIWFNLARNNEAAVASLRTSLEQVLLQNAVQLPNEGFGDSGDVAQSSCCFDAAQAAPDGTCRACRDAEASILLLPCRHLCLCSSCEPLTGVCPICNSAKDGRVEVFLA